MPVSPLLSRLSPPCPQSDGGGGAEEPASGKRSSFGPSPPSPPSPHKTLKPRVRGAGSRARSPDPGIQDGEAAVGGALFLTDGVMARGRGSQAEGPAGAKAWRSG